MKLMHVEELVLMIPNVALAALKDSAWIRKNNTVKKWSLDDRVKVLE